MSQVGAFHKLHGDELDAVRLGQIVDACNVLVRNLVCGEKFLLETSQDRWIRSHFRTNQLERHGALDPAVQGLINGTHPTFAEKLQDLVCRLLLEKKKK